jgi:hypothetical protein
MKWIGQHIYDLVARFRNDVYLEDLSTTTETNVLVVDSDGKVSKTTVITGDVTGVTAGSNITVTNPTGPVPTVALNTSLTGLTSITSTSFVGDVTGVVQVAAQTVIDHDQLANFTADEHFTQANITTVGTIDTGVWNGTAIAHAYIGADAIETDNIADAQVTVAKLHADAVQTSGESFADNDTSLMTSAAIDDAIIKGGSVTYINILPHEFLADKGGGVNKSAQYDDTDIAGGTVDIGVSVGDVSASLFGFADIPVGKTATHVTVFGSNAGNAITVYESNIKTGTLTTKGTGSTDTGDDSNKIPITDVAGTSTNYLVIKSAIGAITNTIYGAQITISG